MSEWINNNWVEMTGAILAFIYLILEIKQKWPFWIVGIVSSAFYVYIFHQAGLYAEMGLNFYYILMGIYGLYCWKFATQVNKVNAGFKSITKKSFYVLLIIFVVLFGSALIILSKFSGSKVPVPDALIAILSIIATWMVAKKIVECWYIWIFVNTFATGLYIHQELYPTAVLFTFYSILSIVGLKELRKSVKKNDTTDTKL
jgi:nicotinamide mononucleotide transporter